MTRAQALALLVLLLPAGLALRLFHLDSFSFRGDEAFTVLHWVSKPLAETLQSEIPVSDPQPPLAYALFRAWALLFGTGEFVMRLLPALGSLPAVAGAYALGHRIGGRAAGLQVAALVAIHPFLVWHAQDARNYALWVSASICAGWLALCALERGRRRDWLLYILAATLAAYLYYLELLLLAALNLYALVAYRKHWRTLRAWLLAQLALAALLAPWFLQERLLFGSGYGGTAAASGGAQSLATWLLPALQFGRSLPPELLARSALLVVCVMLAGLWFLARREKSRALYVGLCAFLPPLLLGLVAARLDVFAPRYVLASAPFCLLLLSETVREFWRRSLPARLLALAICATWLGLMNHSNSNAWFDPQYARAPDWRGLAHYLERETGVRDMVVQAAADEAFTLYHGDRTDFLRLPANPHQDEAEIRAALQAASGSHDSIWLVADPPPGWPNGQVGVDWLETHMQLVRSTRIGTLPLRQYRPWAVQTQELADEPLARFGAVAELAGARRSRSPGELNVELVWRAQGPSEASLKGFVHLYDLRGPAGSSLLWSQDDQFIQDGRTDTARWERDSLFRDVYRLPLAGIPAGDYEVHVGLYEPESGERVPADSGVDSVLIAEVTLEDGATGAG